MPLHISQRDGDPLPFRLASNGFISNTSIPCIFPRISNRSNPVDWSRSVGTVPGSAPGGRRSSIDLISVHPRHTLAPIKTIEPSSRRTRSSHCRWELGEGRICDTDHQTVSSSHPSLRAWDRRICRRLLNTLASHTYTRRGSEGIEGHTANHARAEAAGGDGRNGSAPREGEGGASEEHGCGCCTLWRVLLRVCDERLAWREGALVWIRMVSLMAIGLSNSLSDCSCLWRHLNARILEM